MNKPSLTPNDFAIEELDSDRRDPQLVWVVVVACIFAPLAFLALILVAGA